MVHNPYNVITKSDGLLHSDHKNLFDLISVTKLKDEFKESPLNIFRCDNDVQMKYLILLINTIQCLLLLSSTYVVHPISSEPNRER